MQPAGGQVSCAAHSHSEGVAKAGGTTRYRTAAAAAAAAVAQMLCLLRLLKLCAEMLSQQQVMQQLPAALRQPTPADPYRHQYHCVNTAAAAAR
jgi:hypothetical protein